MAKKKQSSDESKKESGKGPVMFKENIDKHKEKPITEKKETEEETKQRSTTNAYMIKLVLIGDAAVGKTSIRQRYLGHGFQKEHLTTLGADFAATTKEVDEYQIKYQIWDLAGQPMFKNVRPRFFKGCFGSLAVFDTTRRETFLNLSNWIEELYQFSGRGVVPVIILANKVDLVDEQEVTQEEAQEFIDELNKKIKDLSIENFFLETSAKTGSNIEKAFEIIGQYIVERFTSTDDEE
ncbi:MAG: GTP-binding protein [Candidatus Heimdallarchaeota archaeon]|nr:GTP-binding protein [Candidatus Heimdallarchaeota archaeon]